MTSTLTEEAGSECVDDPADNDRITRRRRGIQWSRVVAYGVVPGLVMVSALGAGYAKWLNASASFSPSARVESVQAATDGTNAILSYRFDTVEQDLAAAIDRLTGDFKDSYTSLINEVVIPGAEEQKISATTRIAAAAPVSVSANHAVVLVFVNQTTTIGTDPPTDTPSSVRVSLDNIDGRWLISGFEPV